ncbi:MAG TPA: hypothetical protein VGM41_01460, partial [Chitinophagaceae bacterium]
MARISCLLFFCLLAATAGAQKFVVTNPAQNILYEGIPNSLEVKVIGSPCQSISLSTSNGRIEGVPCHYTCVPTKAGIAKITVWQKSHGKKKKFGESSFRVRPIPDPNMSIGWCPGGAITKKYIIAQGGLIAYPDGESGIDANFSVDSFHVIILRSDSVVFNHQSRGHRYDTESLLAFKDLQAGDMLLFTHIICRGPEGGRRRPNSLEF